MIADRTTWLQPRTARAAAGIAAGVLAACWLAAWAVAQLPSSPGIAVDASAARMLGAAQGTPLVLGLSEFLAVIGEQPVSIVVAVAVAIAVLLWRGLRAALAFGLAAGLSAAHVILMKSVVQRIGPAGHLFEGLGSFPSGHAANAAVLATFAGLLARRGWVWAAAAAYTVLVALSRVVLAAHWFTDTIVGTAAGAAVAVLVFAAAGAVGRTRRVDDAA